MERKGVSKRKPPQAKARLLSKDNASAAFLPLAEQQQTVG